MLLISIPPTTKIRKKKLQYVQCVRSNPLKELIWKDMLNMFLLHCVCVLPARILLQLTLCLLLVENVFVVAGRFLLDASVKL